VVLSGERKTFHRVLSDIQFGSVRRHLHYLVAPKGCQFWRARLVCNDKQRPKNVLKTPFLTASPQAKKVLSLFTRQRAQISAN
jgi:hypothetical protein